MSIITLKPCTLILPRTDDSNPLAAQNQYSQIYGPLGKGDNYTSPLLHTIKLTGLSPKTRYYYQCALSRLFMRLQPSLGICGTQCVARGSESLKAALPCAMPCQCRTCPSSRMC